MISHEQLTASMRDILKTADLDTLSAKQVRKQLEAEFKCELTEHKKFIDKQLMQLLDEQENESSAEKSESEEESEEEPKKKVAPKRKAVPDPKPAAKKKAVPKPKPAVAKSEIYTDSDSDGEFDEISAPPVKRAKATGRKAPGTPRGDVADCKLSPELAAIVGAEVLSRSEVTRRIHQECIIRKLHEEDDRNYIICDEQFKKLFGGQERLRVSTLTNHCKKHITKMTKAELNGGKKKKTGKPSGYMLPVWLDPVLADVLGYNRMARSQVIKLLWKIIKERGLQDPRNKHFILVDDQLKPVFKKKRVRAFGMMSEVGPLMSKEQHWSYDRDYPEYIEDEVKAEVKDEVKGSDEEGETNGVTATSTGS